MMRRHGCLIGGLASVLLAGGLVGWWVLAVARPERLNDRLAAAIRRRDATAVDALLKQGASARAWRQGDPSEGDWDRYRPMLLLALADTRQQQWPYGYVSTPPAAGVGSDAKPHIDLRVVKLLLDHGADPNRGYDDWLPLSAAAAADDIEAVRELVRRGAHVDGHPAKGDTALCVATSKQMAAELLRLGANANARGSEERTPLRRAVERGDAPMVGFLASRGARVRGDGLLIVATDTGNEQVVKALLAAGCDPNEPDAFGERPLGHARSAGRKQIAGILAAAGAR